jgi:hypothetical protein
MSSPRHDFSKMKVVDLRALAKERQLKGYSKLNREGLLDLLRSGKAKSPKAASPRAVSPRSPRGTKKASPKKRNIKSKRAKKDPNAPKRFLTAYFYYLQSIRSELKREFPEAKVTEIARIGGERWRSLSESEKAPFLRMSEKDKQRYEREMSNYDPTYLEKKAKRAAKQ